MSRKIAAIGDIHGCLTELEALSKKILDWFGDDEGTLVLLGDLVDRGPDTKGVLDWVKAWNNSKINLVVLKGNHEELMIQSLLYDDEQHRKCWMVNGGMAAVISMGWQGGVEYSKWLESICLTEYRDGLLYFVHAGVNPARKLDEQLEQDKLWIRDKFLKHSAPYEKGTIIVHGHTVHEKVEVKENRINLDTGCCFGGSLSCALFQDGVLVRVISEPSTLPKR